MPAFVITVAGWFGINPFRLIAYAAIILTVTIGALAVRQHYINKGYASAIAAVKKQDDRAKIAAEKVETKAAVCTETNGYWDVISQGCKLENNQ